MLGSNIAPPPIPDLRIVPIENVLPHEEHDPQRSGPLVDRIANAEIWLSPPVVAPINPNSDEPLEEQRFALLDGANRHYTARSLGFPYILVQVIDYESEYIVLETWNHVLSGIEPDAFLPKIYKIDGLHVEHSDALTAQAALARREAVAYLRVLPDWVLMMVADQQDIASRTASLRALVNTYKREAHLNRMTHDHPHTIRQVYPDAVAVVLFPHYEPAEIIVASRDKIYLPPGISRHIIHGRALRLNYPIDVLKTTDGSLAEKNEELKAWISERFTNRRARFYQEATYIFDE